MPRFPQTAPHLAALGGSIYSTLAHRLAQHTGEIYPFHVGDTWMEPAEGCRMEDLTVAEYPGLHRYTPVTGLPTLVDALVDRTTARSGVATTRAEVFLTAGATAGVALTMGAVVAPGDEVLVLAPYWPLVGGAIRLAQGVVVPIPFEDPEQPLDALIAALDRARTDRTVALYFNTPHNPTGRVLPGDWIEALCAWARRADVWILSDEVYEHYAYQGEHTCARRFAPERTVVAWSFSKAYGMAGNRCGWLAGPAALLTEAQKIATNVYYSVPTPAQRAAIRALDGAGDAWAADAARQYAQIGAEAAAALDLPAPQGSTFLFFDVAHRLDGRGLPGFLSDCVDRGLLLAPGTSFGPYPTHVRLCYTASPPEVTRRGLTVLKELMG